MENSKPTVIFDLDSTLNDLHHHLYEAFKSHLKLDKHYQFWTSYHLSETYQVPFDEILVLINKFDLLHKSMPLPGAVDLFSFMRDRFDIGIITARQCFEDSKTKTLNWLLKHNLMPHWTEIASDKHVVIKEKVGQCLFFLDDSPSTLINVLESGTAKNVATLKYAWSKSLPSEVLQFENLLDVQCFLKGQIKPTGDSSDA